MPDESPQKAHSLDEIVRDSFTFKSVFSVLFNDLKLLIKVGEKEAFFDLFYGRSAEVDTFVTQLGHARQLGTNIVVKGDPGSGKTTFIHRIMHDDELLGELRIFPVFLDLRELNGGGGATLHMEIVVSGLAEYFDDVGAPLAGLEDDSTPTVDRFHRAVAHLNKGITKGLRQKKTVVLFVDDADYCEPDVLPRVLKILARFTSSVNCVVVFACRQPVWNLIFGDTDSTLSRDFRFNSYTLPLPHLPVRDLLISRLAPCLLATEQDDHLHPLDIVRFKRAFKKLRAIFDVLSLLPSTQFQYPFTKRIESFIQHATNGNVNEMFLVAGELLRYILKNRKELEEGDRPGSLCVPRPVLLELFDPNKTTEGFRVIKISERVSTRRGKGRGRAGNFLLQNVMEAITICPVKHHDFYDLLEQVGFSNEEADEGLDRCRALRLMRRRVIHVGLASDIDTISEYQLTNKGHYYLFYMIHWEEYIRKFGRSRRSLFNLASHTLPYSDVHREILEVMRNLLYVTGFTRGRFLVRKPALFGLMKEIIPDTVLPNLDALTGYLRSVRVVSTHKLSDKKDYVMIVSQLKAAIRGAGLSMEVDKDFVSLNRYREFVDKRVKLPPTKRLHDQ